MTQIDSSLPLLLAELPLPAIAFKSTILPALGVAALLIVVHGVFVFASSRRLKSARLGWLATALYALFVALVALLGVSSLGSVVLLGHMSGYALLAHVAAAGAFTFLLVAIAYFYLPWADVLQDETTQRWWLVRWSAWGLMLSCIAAAATMFLSMLPILDSEGLLQAAEVHRFAGLAVVATALVHLYSLSCTKMGLR